MRRNPRTLVARCAILLEICDSPPINVLDVVALLVDIPEHGLVRGQVGSVVERLDDHVFEVELSDDEGRTCEMIALGADLLRVVHAAVAPPNDEAAGRGSRSD